MFRVWGSGFRVQGSGFGFRAWASGFGVSGLGFRVWGLGRLAARWPEKPCRNGAHTPRGLGWGGGYLATVHRFIRYLSQSTCQIESLELYQY